LTIELNNRIVGGTGYYVNSKEKIGQITWIFFDPNYSGKGLGKQSVEYCLKILQKDKKVEKIMVTTSQLAYKFFEKFGFKTIRIEKDYWRKGIDLFEMEMIKPAANKV
jgi:ribosomal protein S18 acetylase RimI-like enzyme